MAGLNSLVSGTETSATTLPSWYDNAQQQIVANAQSGAAVMPTLANTVAGTAISNLSGANNPFQIAQANLANTAQGLANPFNVSSTGAITPNVNSPLGALYGYQNQQLKTLIPQITSPTDAAAISGGQFGSLRNQTAADVALTNAQANLAASQMQSALNAQQTGVNANTALGNIGAQGTTAETALGQLQQAAPLTGTSDVAQILNTIKAPTATTLSAQLPLSQQLSGLGSLLNAGCGVLNALGITSKQLGGIGSATNTLKNLIGGASCQSCSNHVISSCTPQCGSTQTGINISGSGWTPVYTPCYNLGPSWSSQSGTSCCYTGGGYSGCFGG